jgi:hypothetical protein
MEITDNTIKELKSVEDMFAYCQAANPTEQKANENLDITQNANWYSAAGIKNSIKDLTAKSGKLLPHLREGFEGSNLPDSYPIPYDITDYFMKGKAAWTDSAIPAVDAQQLTDNASTLTQVPFILQINITDEMIAGSTDEELKAKMEAKLAKAFVRTIEGCIINGDTETGATGNVNSDDQAPATTFGTAQYHSLKIDNGIRESAINNSGTYDVGAFDSDDMVAVKNLLAERYLDEDDDLLYIFNTTTWSKAMTDDAFKLAVNNSKPTIEGGVPRPWGIDATKTALVPKTEADGKVSATPGNNTLGQFACVYKPAIRWGFGKDFMIETSRVDAYGYTLTASAKFSFVILDRTNTVKVGRNMTL